MCRKKFVIVVMAFIAASACQALESDGAWFSSDASQPFLDLKPGSIELGADASASYVGIKGSDAFIIGLPDKVRFGVFISRSASIVSRLATSTVIRSGDHLSLNSFALGISQYNFSADRRSGIVLEVMGLVDFWVSDNDGGSQFGGGFGIGFQGFYRAVCPRVEIVFERWMKNESPSMFVIKALFGFSFYGLN